MADVRRAIEGKSENLELRKNVNCARMVDNGMSFTWWK